MAPPKIVISRNLPVLRASPRLAADTASAMVKLLMSSMNVETVTIGMLMMSCGCGPTTLRQRNTMYVVISDVKNMDSEEMNTQIANFWFGKPRLGGAWVTFRSWAATARLLMLFRLPHESPSHC